jgi:hypothetical protein
MTVNVQWWNEHFATQARSIGLSEDEAESVLLRAPIHETGVRFEALLARIAETDPARHEQIRQAMQTKISETKI